MTIFNTQTITELAKKLQAGSILAYPTESVWGLGCDPFNEQAVMQLLALKNRPVEKGVILIAGSIEQALPLISHLDADIQQRIQASWQQKDVEQATTWLVPLEYKGKTIDVPIWITGKHASVAVRVTPHTLVQQLCQSFGGVLVSTSCNRSAEEPAVTLKQAQEYFAGSVDYLQGETLKFTKPSQIKDAVSMQQVR